MRILHILDHSIPLHSGYTFRTLAILREQRARGWETFQITGPKQGPCATPEEKVGEWMFYRTPPALGMASRLPIVRQLSIVTQLAARISELVEELRPDILHAHSPALNGLAALKVSRKFGVPVVYEVRAFWEDAAVDHGTNSEGGPRYRLSRALETFVLKRAAAVTTICEGLRNDIVARGIAPENVTVIPNAVDVNRFCLSRPPNPYLAEALALTGKKVLGFVGSFYAYEGLDLLVRALPAMLEREPNVRALLVGGGPEASRLQELTQQLRLADNVVFTGRVAHDQIEKYYDLIDVLVYPRLPMRLTELVTPLKPLEAMALGRSVVASDVGGHKELIRDGETGLLFQAGSASSLSDAVLGLLTNAELESHIRLNGRKYVEDVRTWRNSVSYYTTLYAKCLTKGRRSTATPGM